MIARIEGTLVERATGASTPYVIVDCGGIGYQVACSLYTFAALPEDNARVALRVFTHATENRIALFGFLEAAERALFDLLITVKNVGPSTAIAILSGSSPREIVEMVAREDVAGLVRLKGVGKKTAEMIVVELHDKCRDLLATWQSDSRVAVGNGKRRTAVGQGLTDEVMTALVGMGWSTVEAEAAVGDLVVAPETTLEQLLRQALRSMPR